ncbi:MAG TPA: PASTA domain-containing protein [Pyrinomonadaceae bacterium]|nr:PASTA domain-containing protein [Pyrinomonadaceae bacterium]
MLDFAVDLRPFWPRAWIERQTLVAFINSALLALKRVLIVILIAIAFSVGLFGAIILSLHSSQTKVPDIMGKDRISAENAIEAAHLNFRVRAIRPVSDAKPNTVIIQIPNAGEEVKVGQTVAVDLSRPAKEGEPAPTTTEVQKEAQPENANERAANANDNKPKRNRNANSNNKNGNDNQNGNDNNRNRNGNANGNANRVTTGNQNLNTTGIPNNRNDNASRSPANANHGNANLNTNRRRAVTAPTPN